jgi:uncharacterized RDD family membrane protein YckC
MSHGRALIAANIGIWTHAYHVLLMLAIAAYFQICWTLKGQTLGMKAWSLKLVRLNGHAPRTIDVLRRLMMSAPPYLLIIATILYTMRWHASPYWQGLAALPLAVDLLWAKRPGSQTLVDRWSGTRLYRETAS